MSCMNSSRQFNTLSLTDSQNVLDKRAGWRKRRAQTHHLKSEEDDQDPNAVVDEDTFVACMVDYFDEDCHDCLCAACEIEFEAACP